MLIHKKSLRHCGIEENYQQDGHTSVELNMKNVLKPFKEPFMTELEAS